jgi:hypothetical protein
MSNLVASGVLDHPARYLSRGWVSISVPNLVVIAIMLALFVLALVVPFPKGDHDEEEGP